MKKLSRYGLSLLRMLLRALLSVLYLLSGFCPRNAKIWLFGCWRGKRFRGNSRILYDYVRINCPEVEAVWVTKSPDLYEELKKNGVRVLYAYSLSGFLMTLRAKYFFVTHGIGDMNEYASRKGIMINLDHAIYPIKNMFLALEGSVFERIMTCLRDPYAYLVKPDYATTSSSFTARATRNHYRLSDERIIITGTPKTDFLLARNSDHSERFKDRDYREFCEVDQGMRRILFLPTWRSDSRFSIFDYGFDGLALDSLLKGINGILAFNFHPSDLSNQTIPDAGPYENIKYFNYQEDQINGLLRGTDILITDYSALYADFLIYDRPMIFAKFDHDNYIRERGLFLDYERDLPGPKAENWPDLLLHIRNAVLNPHGLYGAERRALRDLIYPQRDGRACERIVRFVKLLDEPKRPRA